MYFDALRVKIRDEGLVRNKAVYLAIGITCDGDKEVLGLWIEQTEGAKFWLRVMNELKARGTQDLLIGVVDGLKGFPEAITTVFPDGVVQTCVVHLIRYSLPLVTCRFCSGRDLQRIGIFANLFILSLFPDRVVCSAVEQTCLDQGWRFAISSRSSTHAADNMFSQLGESERRSFACTHTCPPFR